jgi:hypothetical protein
VYVLACLNSSTSKIVPLHVRPANFCGMTEALANVGCLLASSIPGYCRVSRPIRSVFVIDF